MKVDIFRLTRSGASASAQPEAIRISTAEGVFWLAHDGGSARLVLLPSRARSSDDAPTHRAEEYPAWLALALAAETEAASRWTRQGTTSQTTGVVGEAVTLDTPG